MPDGALSTTAPTRPALRWHGGKWLLAPWIIAHLPQHRIYVEPFGGAASVLLRKGRAHAEIYNDLDDEVVTLFRVLRDAPAAARLREALALTPFARTEFVESYQQAECPVERSRRLVIRSFMGFGSNAHASQAKGHRSTGFRANSRRSGTTPAHDWANYPAAMEGLVARLAGVTVENRDAREVMLQHDGADTLHYVDPPYLPETRSSNLTHTLRAQYRHELTHDQHVEMLGFLRALTGMVVLSGYPAEAYDAGLPGWRRVERASLADGARPRREVLWLNPAADAALNRYLPLEDRDA